MWKITLIAWVIFFVLRIVANIMAGSLSTEEQLIYKTKNQFPLRLDILGCVIGLEFIVSVILTIITIIRW